MNHPSPCHHRQISEDRLMREPHVAIIGLGLIGASLAAALKRSGAAGAVLGYDTDNAAVEYCLEQEYIDRSVPLHEAGASADIIILATPVGCFGALAKTLAPALRAGTVVSDVASVKQAAVAALRTQLPEHAELVPAHPIAGSSSHGAESADASLFEGKLVVLCPDKDTTSNRAIAAIARLWESTGAHTERMADRNHDILYGYVSHLPQLMAYAACTALADEPLPSPLPDSFRRFIRLGASNPRLWAGIVSANVESVSHALAHVLATIDHMQNEFSDGEKKGVESTDNPIVAGRLFPLMAAASLISVINQFEMQNSIQLAPYAGSGFRDFTAPTGDDPDEEDFAAISNHYAHVARCLRKFYTALLAIHEALADPSAVGQSQLLQLLEQAQQHHQHVQMRMQPAT